jgi:hypothetical protein
LQLFVPSEAKIHTDILSSSFRSSKLEFGIPSEKFVTENLKEISKAVQLLVTENLIFQNSFFYDNSDIMKIFTRVQKKNWTKKILNFNFSTHIIPTKIFIFPQILQKKITSRKNNFH